MKAIVNTAPGCMEWREWPKPEPGPGQVRIRCTACGICATDLEMLAGWERTGFPAIPGHEWTGVVDALGPGVSGLSLQSACVAENVLADGGEVGFEHPGGYSEYFVTDACGVHSLPPDYPAAAATLIEPLAVCVRALRRLRLENPGAMLILGDGPIGLLMLLLAQQAGVKKVTLVGGRTSRLQAARNLGATRTVNYHDLGAADNRELVQALAGPYPNIVECSGSPGALTTALALAGKQGKILVIGDYAAARAEFAWNTLLHRELELIGSNASAGAWAEAVELALVLRPSLETMITAVYAARHFAEALEAVQTGRDHIKVVLSWQET